MTLTRPASEPNAHTCMYSVHYISKPIGLCACMCIDIIHVALNKLVHCRCVINHAKAISTVTLYPHTKLCRSCLQGRKIEYVLLTEA